jgi:hypothetical protein
MATRNELYRFADEHLFYEIEMVHGLTQRMLRHRELFKRGLKPDDHELAPDVLDMPGRNADIEAFVVHAANVWNFLRCNGKGGDVNAHDYFDRQSDWKGKSERPQSVAVLNKRYAIEIGHLSITRHKVVDKNWPYEQIWLDLAGLLRRFLRDVPDGRVSATFRQQVGALLPSPNQVVLRRHAPAALTGATNTSFHTILDVESPRSTGGVATSDALSATSTPDLYRVRQPDESELEPNSAPTDEVDATR